jgi:sulfide:quinone oxidoreductase
MACRAVGPTVWSMNEPAIDQQRHEPLEVLIAGAGVAGLEAAFALRQFAGDRVQLKLLTPSEAFVYRPLAVAEPFSSGVAQRYPLARLAADAGAELVLDSLAHVDADERLVRTAAGAEIAYGALLICTGVIAQPAFDHAITFDDSQIDALLHGLVQDVEDGYIKRLGIVMPAPLPWPLPAYELALMVSERAWDMQVQTQVTVLTPEQRPLAVFGAEASLEVSRLLARRHVDLVTSAYCEMSSPNIVRVHPGDRTFEFDRVVALPVLKAPRITGLPQDGGGFIPVDDFGRVRHVDHVWAAGDATDFPVKHGGVAAQMADTAAQSIASVTGACEAPPPFDPQIEGVLLTGATPRQLRGGHLTGGHGSESELVKIARGALPPKIAARYLTPHLDGLQSSEAPATASK